MFVANCMTKNPITIAPDVGIDEAAKIMDKGHFRRLPEKIGGMPVLSEVGKVVGIISSTDIFRAFVTVMGLDSGKTRLTIAVADRKGVLRDIATVLADLDINIDSMVTIPQPSGTYDIIIRADIADVETVKERLAAKGFTVSHVTQIG